MKIGIVGAGGYVRNAFLHSCDQQGYRYVTFGRQATIDIPTCVAQIEQAGLDCLINRAGYTGKPNVDACELH